MIFYLAGVISADQPSQLLLFLLLKSEVPPLALISLRIVPNIITNPQTKFKDDPILLRLFHLKGQFQCNVEIQSLDAKRRRTVGVVRSLR